MEAISLLGRLRKAVKKIRFMMNFSIQRWRLAAMLGRTSSRNLRLSFTERPGLKACSEDIIMEEEQSVSSSSRGLQRTTSYASEDDVDSRAEAFIANFYRQLRIERQVSLELQYCRGNSFD
ncbi:uncharacterized protein LOC101218317 [Cucumis sativus]|uniref:DUF761 domain-containing protein n=1 Tax=Cucumis sativus TaxID=3659 RepID=A0A0A0LUK4_CUCSA|nr:uncharacterized protein LOC101218317 [Cucumis sativus]KGN65448.1 hypothetical protein Csa_019865 [Cucumis sativus]